MAGAMYARLVSLKWRLLNPVIFVHINKTGGSSVEHALGLKFAHLTAREHIARLGRTRWERAFTFSIVRNPWDKVVSHYQYRVDTNQTNLRDSPISFRDWVRLSYGDRDPKYFDKPKMFMPQRDWLTDESGTIAVDYIGRFEHLEQDFSTVCEQLGTTAKLPHMKKSKRGDCRDYYDDETAEIVARVFAEDIDEFGYRFEIPSRVIQ